MFDTTTHIHNTDSKVTPSPPSNTSHIIHSSISGNNTKNINNGNPSKANQLKAWNPALNSHDKNCEFFMFHYKVTHCPNRKQCPLNRKVTCAGYHHERERRRNPGNPPAFAYNEEPCPNIKVHGATRWNPPSSCADGDTCKYAHTLLEQMYHPNIYKTSMCINYINSSGNSCQWGYYCTHAHGHQDIRSTSKSKNKKNKNTSNMIRRITNDTRAERSQSLGGNSSLNASSPAFIPFNQQQKYHQLNVSPLKTARFPPRFQRMQQQHFTLTPPISHLRQLQQMPTAAPPMILSPAYYPSNMQQLRSPPQTQIQIHSHSPPTFRPQLQTQSLSEHVLPNMQYEAMANTGAVTAATATVPTLGPNMNAAMHTRHFEGGMKLTPPYNHNHNHNHNNNTGAGAALPFISITTISGGGGGHLKNFVVDSHNKVSRNKNKNKNKNDDAFNPSNGRQRRTRSCEDVSNFPLQIQLDEYLSPSTALALALNAEDSPVPAPPTMKHRTTETLHSNNASSCSRNPKSNSKNRTNRTNTKTRVDSNYSPPPPKAHELCKEKSKGGLHSRPRVRHVLSPKTTLGGLTSVHGRPTRNKRAVTLPDLSSISRSNLRHNIYSEDGQHLTSPTEPLIIPDSFFTGVDFGQKSTEIASAPNNFDMLNLFDLPKTPPAPVNELEILRTELQILKSENRKLKSMVCKGSNSNINSNHKNKNKNKTNMYIDHDDDSKDSSSTISVGITVGSDDLPLPLPMPSNLVMSGSWNPELRLKPESSSPSTSTSPWKEKFRLCPCCRIDGNARNQVIIPCGHLVCIKCVKYQSNCKICNVNINEFLRVVFDEK